MPLITRRDALKSLAALPLLKLLEPTFSFATGGNDGKNLILINLAGGFDSLAVFPYRNDPNVANQANGFIPFLQNNRPAGGRDGYSTFMLPVDNIISPTKYYMANDYIGFSPAWLPLFNLFEQGSVPIKLIQSVGINPGAYADGSHYVCENCYTYADKDYVNHVRKPWFAHLIESLDLTHNQAFSFGTLSRADFITEAPFKGPIIGTKTEAINWQDYFSSTRQNLNIETARQLLAASTTENAIQEKIKTALGDSYDAIELMANINTATNPGGPKALIGTYPNDGIAISPTLKSVGRILSYFNGDNKNRLFYTLQGGFDTHVEQGGFHGTTGAPGGALYLYINSLAKSLKALIDDLKNPQRYVWDKTVIVIFSEFGRTTRANGGFGTDHGNGSTFMVLGGPIQNGVLGQAPTLSVMSEKNWYYPQVAFQNIFSPIVSWFGANGAEIFPTNLYTVNGSVANSIIG